MLEVLVTVAADHLPKMVDPTGNATLVFCMQGTPLTAVRVLNEVAADPTI